jgi:DNA-binding response OmpR family regulator
MRADTRIGQVETARMPDRRQRVLVVEDEPMVAEVVERYLRRDGYDVHVVHDGAVALADFARVTPDLVVLDVMLPGMDGMEVCRRIRSSSETPIIMLTARGDEIDKLLGLGVGADDYVTKPFSPRELTARVRTVLRRAGRARPVDGTIRYGDLGIDEGRRTVERGQREIPVTAREFDLLVHLAKHANQVFTREQLMNAVWDYEFAGDSATVTVHIRRLRAKIESDPSRPRHLKTVWGVGYKFEP